MYHAWRADPSSVHVSWQSVFARLDAGAAPGQSFVPPPNLNAGASLQSSAVPRGDVSLASPQQSSDVTKVLQMIHAYQTRGHNVADLDPLGIYDADLDGSTPPDLELANYGFTEADMDKEFQLSGLMQSGFLSGETGPMKLRDILTRLRQVYTTSIGVEYMHIWDHEQVNWIREQIETPEAIQFTPKEKKIRCSTGCAGRTTSRRSSRRSTRRRSASASRAARSSSSA